MRWEEVRAMYPNQYVLLKVLAYREQENTRHIEEVEVVDTIQTPQEATKQLLRLKFPLLVFHTGKPQVTLHLRKKRNI
ncbi:hypothetical protein [Aneurinibacillus tyrosinisolvens]|uniref:hypothetical protein n=1 Tax=Aneurinibacillus tyrosinisolvens TaxID=1443435 RepID=UPI00063F5604|nr:hypothetical protein [Aneurinibacillus tyrosinisolvens]